MTEKTVLVGFVLLPRTGAVSQYNIDGSVANKPVRPVCLFAARYNHISREKYAQAMDAVDGVEYFC